MMINIWDVFLSYPSLVSTGSMNVDDEDDDDEFDEFDDDDDDDDSECCCWCQISAWYEIEMMDMYDHTVCCIAI